ncbi:class I adenylate-forming enzyme family protein [Streptosporangium sp. NPDC000095]|uniref:class I adenylate-forming enzyme family protein n=1 Tax=Streptosporangium sp. NPDC000095 TaxID=3366184 RepID=UPI00368B4EE2
MTAIGDLVLDALRARPDHVAFLHGGAGLTYREAERLVLGVADTLAGAGLQPGDTVLQIRPNDPLQWLVNAACYVAGHRSAALSPGALRGAALAERLDLVAPDAVLTEPGDPDLDAWLRARPEVRVLTDRDLRVLTDRDLTATVTAAGEPGVAVPAPAPASAVVRLAFTSGTTGPVKGVELSGGALGTVATVLRDTLPWPERPRVLCPESVSGGFGNMVLPTLMLGGTFVVPERPGPEALLEAAVRHRPTVLMAMPPALRALLVHPGAAGHDWSSLALVVYSGASFTDEEIDRAHALFGEVLCGVFGQVEVPKTIAWTRPADHLDPRFRSSLGVPFPGTEVRVCGPDGRDLPAGQPGELWVRGPTTARGYAFPPGTPFESGWLRTGDVCRRDAHGRLHHVNRVQDVLRTGDAYVCPSDLEAVVSRHIGHPAAVVPTGPGGVAVLVEGVAPPDTGPRGAASRETASLGTVSRDTTSPGTASWDKVEKTVRDALRDAPVVIDAVLPAERLPRDVMGRLDRARLAEVAG